MQPLEEPNKYRFFQTDFRDFLGTLNRTTLGKVPGLFLVGDIKS